MKTIYFVTWNPGPIRFPQKTPQNAATYAGANLGYGVSAFQDKNDAIALCQRMMLTAGYEHYQFFVAECIACTAPPVPMKRELRDVKDWAEPKQDEVTQ